MNPAIVSVAIVWLVLMLSTAASTWWFSMPMFKPTVSTVAVMVLTAVKVGLVMSHFMEMWNAPRVLQFVGAVWVVVTASVIIAFYLL